MRKRNPKTGGHRFPKNVDEDYREWIRRRPCLAKQAGGCWGGTQCAHVKTKGSGGPDLGNLVPLCAAHHGEQHKGIKTFQKKYGLDLADAARRLTEAYEDGV